MNDQETKKELLFKVREKMIRVTCGDRLESWSEDDLKDFLEFIKSKPVAKKKPFYVRWKKEFDMKLLAPNKEEAKEKAMNQSYYGLPVKDSREILEVKEIKCPK